MGYPWITRHVAYPWISQDQYICTNIPSFIFVDKSMITFDMPKWLVISRYTQVFVTLDGTFETFLLRTSSGPRSAPKVTNPGYHGLSQFIWWYPWPVIVRLSTGQFLSCHCLRIAPYNRMNVAFLVYTDSTVYQICTPTVKSHGRESKYAAHPLLCLYIQVHVTEYA